MAADEIERFRREIIERTGDRPNRREHHRQELLREVMNTVGKPGQLGGSIRCVVSVSMLTEGWDANTVTHVLGIRAFGTQLLCEQVIGRALRRQSYDLNEEGLFNVEYADVLAFPSTFTAKPVIAPPQPPRETIQVKAVRPDRDALEIRFPRVEGYRVELPEERLVAEFNDDSILELSPDLVGPSITRNSGIIGEGVDLSLKHLGDMRPFDAALQPHQAPSLHQVARSRAKSQSSTCSGSSSASPSSGWTPVSSARAAPIPRCSCIRNWPIWPATASPPESPERWRANAPSRPCSIRTIPSARRPRQFQHLEDRPVGNRRRRCHLNWVILDSDWEASSAAWPSRIRRFAPTSRTTTSALRCRIATARRCGSILPDFIVLVDDGHGDNDLCTSSSRSKGYRREDAKEKKSTMETYWVPGVNHLSSYGRWAFAEFTEVYQIEADFKAKVESEFNKMIESVVAKTIGQDA
jgi:type III restriction enzyme